MLPGERKKPTRIEGRTRAKIEASRTSVRSPARNVTKRDTMPLTARSPRSQKLTAVSATSKSVTANLKALQRVPCIRYPVQFQVQQVEALIDSGSEVNAMTPAFAAKLGLSTKPTGVGAQKIDGSPLATYGMAVAAFSLQDSLGKVRFFEETFLLADTSMKVVQGMPFLAFSNAGIQFEAEKLTWRSYTVEEDLPTARRVELIDKHEFAKAALGENSETFVMHFAALEAPEPAVSMNLSRAPRLAVLQQDKALTEIPLEYADYSDVFLFDLAMELPENTGINEHAIKLVKGKQPPYGPI